MSNIYTYKHIFYVGFAIKKFRAARVPSTQAIELKTWIQFWGPLGR